MEGLTAQVQAVTGLLRPADGPGPVVLGIDGRSGAGKSRLAGAMVARLRAGGRVAQVLALEDSYRGWLGLADGVRAVANGVLEPLARGRPGSYRRYDWSAGELAGLVHVPPVGRALPEVLVVEGCGAGSAPMAAFLDMLVWLEAPEPVRRARALARDEHTWVALWDTWAAQESALLAERDAPAEADLVLVTG